MPNWREVLDELIAWSAQNPTLAHTATDVIRRKYLAELHQHTGRNLIAYYSGFLSRPGIMQSSITDEDKNGFMMGVHNVNRSKGLDLILHTPGGDIAATHSIVNYLQKMFGSNIRAIVPQIAMSAGTMIACSCQEILMGSHSNLGPIDPHLRGIPTFGVIREFRRAYKEVKKDPSKTFLWQTIIGQYRPTFLGQCENALIWSNKFVQDQLEKVMFSGDPNARKKAKKILAELSDYQKNKVHDRHIHFDECQAMGLKVTQIENDQRLQDLVLTVHHCYMHAFMNSTAYKIIENHLGSAIVRNMTPTTA